MIVTTRSRRPSRLWRRSLLAAWLAWSAAYSCVAQAQADDLGDVADTADGKSGADGAAAAAATASAGADASNAADGGDVEQARQHFERGVEYYNDGDYHAAFIEFQRAYKLRPAYRLLYNLGQVAFELRDYAGAEGYFRSYLADGQDDVTPERRAEVQGELEQLQKRVASVNITTNQPDADIRIDDRAIDKSAGMPVRVSAGRRRFVAEKPGYAPVQRVVDVLGGESLEVQLMFGPQLVPTSGVAAHGRSSSSALPWVTGIGSGVVLLAAGGFGYAAYHDSSKHADLLRQYTTRQELDRLESQARTKALVSDILLGTGILGGIVTMVLVLSSSSDDAPPANTAKAKPLQLGAAGLIGHF